MIEWLHFTSRYFTSCQSFYRTITFIIELVNLAHRWDRFGKMIIEIFTRKMKIFNWKDWTFLIFTRSHIQLVSLSPRMFRHIITFIYLFKLTIHQALANRFISHSFNSNSSAKLRWFIVSMCTISIVYIVNIRQNIILK